MVPSLKDSGFRAFRVESRVYVGFRDWGLGFRVEFRVWGFGRIREFGLSGMGPVDRGSPKP